MKIFLDLEETIIQSWGDPTLTNVLSIKNWLDTMSERPTTINIFSFAIHDGKDKHHFMMRGIKSMIELALDVKIDEVLTVPEAMQIVTEWSGLRFDGITDFIQVLGKHEAFVRVCLAREHDCHCVLVDDAVPSRTIIDHQRHLTIDLLPVQLLGFTSGRVKINNRI